MCPKSRGRSKGTDVLTGSERAGNRRHCPECESRLVSDDDDGERVCRECGLVVDADRIDRGPEWRAFDAEQRRKKSRVGGPTTKLRHDDGLSTRINWNDRDAMGTELSPSQRETAARLRLWNRRSRVSDAQDRNLRQALGEVDRMGSALGLPESVRETAAVIYRRALDADVVFGRSIEAVATASVYAAARQAGVPRSISEMEPVSRVDRQSFTRAYRHVLRALDLEVDLADPRVYLRRFASELDLDDAVEYRARELLDLAEEEGVHVGKSPTGLAGAAIYAAGRLEAVPVTQSEICSVANVSEVTIRNRYPELEALADDE